MDNRRIEKHEWLESRTGRGFQRISINKNGEDCGLPATTLALFPVTLVVVLWDTTNPSKFVCKNTTLKFTREDEIRLGNE